MSQNKENKPPQTATRQPKYKAQPPIPSQSITKLAHDTAVSVAWQVLKLIARRDIRKVRCVTARPFLFLREDTASVWSAEFSVAAEKARRVRKVAKRLAAARERVKDFEIFDDGMWNWERERVGVKAV